MIEKTEETKHKWEILDVDVPCAAIIADSGEVRMDFLGDYINADLILNTFSASFDLSEMKEFHQALGEAIAVAEAQDE